MPPPSQVLEGGAELSWTPLERWRTLGEQIDDDEQEGPSLANSPGGAPSSYAAGEEGGGITEVEDEELPEIPEEIQIEMDRLFTRGTPGSGKPAYDPETHGS